jgi:hypothetical protein
MIKKLLLLSGFAIALAVAGLWAGSPRETEAHTWAPFFGPPDFYTLAPTTPGANSDIRTQYNVFTPSANFSGLFGRAITFGDKDVTQSSAAAIPGVGAYIGSLTTVPILGLANEGCNSGAVTFVFNFVEANVDITALPIDTPPGDGNPATSNDPMLLNGAITNVAGTLLYDGASGRDPLKMRDDNAFINEIQIDSEQMLITGVNAATNTYTVTRAWNGTTAAAHADNAEIKKVNVIFPSGPASQLLANMAEDDGDFDGATSGGAAPPPNDVEFADFAGNDVADAADAGAPSFVRDSMDPDGDPDNGGYIQPHARYYSTLLIANSLIVLLQFVLQNNGVLAANNFQNLGWADTNWGYSSTTFLQDPLAPPSNSAISDFCNFSSNTRFFGITHDNQCTDTITLPAACQTVTPDGFTMRLAVDNGGPTAGVGTCAGTVPTPTTPNECGSVRQTNPAAAQVVRYYQYGVTQRDLDNDGHMNALDTCDQIANPNWDPRAFNGLSGADADADGLPTACDPNDASANNDQDGDAWQNRIDNCPTVFNSALPGNTGGTVPNTFQYDQDVDPGVGGVTNHVSDGGPSTDSIGVACDPAAAVSNGHYHAAYAAQTICIGVIVADPFQHPDDCSSTLDADQDGVVNARDTCLFVNSSVALNPGSHGNPPKTFLGPSGQDTISLQNDADTITVGSATGFVQGSPIVITSPLETVRYITAISGNIIDFTPALSGINHGAGDPVAQVDYAQPIFDLNNSGFVDSGDMGLITDKVGANGGNGVATSQYLPGSPSGTGPGVQYQARLDINDGPAPDNIIDTGDQGKIGGATGIRCGPVP